MIKLKNITLCTFFLVILGVVTGYAQESVTSTGGVATGAGGSVTYAVGQVAYTMQNNVASTVQQGVIGLLGVNNANDFSAFSIIEQTGPAVINAVNHTVAIEVANGTNLSSLVATFTLSAGATAKVGATAQVSGTTVNDFTSDVTYVVTAEDGVTTQDWVVTVTVAPANATAITAFSFSEQTGTATIGSGTIAIEVANGTNLSSLVANFTLSAGATAKVGATTQVSGTTVNDFTSDVTYTVTAEDGVTTQDWVVSVTVAPASATAITAFSFSEQTGTATIGSGTIAIEVANGTDLSSLVATFTLSAGATAKVGTTDQVSGTTANDFTSDVTYTVTAEDGVTTQDWVVSVTVAPANATAITAFSFSEQTGPATIGSGTIVIEVATGTNLSSLVATFTLSAGATAKVGATDQVSGTTVNDFTSDVTYVVTAEDGVTTQDWVVSVTAASTNATAITAYSFSEQIGGATIGSGTIAIEVATGTSLSSLVATFTLSAGATAKVGATDQVSGTTVNDFTSDVTYTVTAEDGVTTQDWVVTVTEAPATAAAITAFSFAEQTGAAAIGSGTIAIEVANGTNLSSLVATFTLSAGATAKVGTTAQVSGTTANDFTSDVTYVVTAQDGVTTQDWVVTVTEALAGSDDEDPTISFVTAPPSELESGSVNIQVNAGDNVGVTSVNLLHSGIRSEGSTWTTLAATDQVSGVWSASISISMLDELGVALYFEASDAAGNSAQTATVYIYKSFSSTSAPDIPNSVFGVGGTASSWRMFSIPYELENKNISAIFETALGAYDKSKWRLVRYQASSDSFVEYKSGLNTIELGKGYWFNAASSTGIPDIVLGTGSLPRVAPGTLASIPLDVGWTQIGNPYPWAMNWSDVLTFNSSDAEGLKVFTGGTTLTDATVLEPFAAAYVFSDGSDVQVPFSSSPSSRSRIKENLNSIDQEDWEVKISIESGEFSNSIGKIGMSPEAKEDKDNLDAMRVPRFVKYTDLTFRHPEFWYPWFSGDVVPRQQAYTWEFEASNNTDAPVMLKWDNSYFGENDFQLYLEDLENGMIVSMRENDFYAYEKDSLRNFKIHYGRTQEIFDELSLGINLGASYPNPFSTSTVIPFTLPDKGVTFNVRLEVYDVLGNQVDVLCDQSLLPGIHKMEWNGNDGQGRNVQDGFYILMMKISSGSTNTTLSQKILKR